MNELPSTKEEIAQLIKDIEQSNDHIIELLVLINIIDEMISETDKLIEKEGKELGEDSWPSLST
eukprot:CAMPEP_0114584686 /NCGR_PEP_ID=MMETSP0125-20121206/8344_1 /TAXON_ID=485358 ORGANISM="Aristerostoma sp., Strain ATCC 50986" /NCGR_SAMPLE_ID=MMETSP0125 /ASSEMBLY_ACC=CAM_ASM_000245 /LENGTH=63 /DNA_ID=CAMNT_0001779241 /DNA_START=631 /DNA_END=822 /DNA_ORIENTATION=+